MHRSLWALWWLKRKSCLIAASVLSKNTHIYDPVWTRSWKISRCSAVLCCPALLSTPRVKTKPDRCHGDRRTHRRLVCSGSEWSCSVFVSLRCLLWLSINCLVYTSSQKVIGLPVSMATAPVLRSDWLPPSFTAGELAVFLTLVDGCHDLTATAVLIKEAYIWLLLNSFIFAVLIPGFIQTPLFTEPLFLPKLDWGVSGGLRPGSLSCLLL